MIDFSKQLNPAQLEAVTTINGPVLVIAGAGSGKTRVIEYRVLYLLQNNVNPHSILLLTFTKRAAREMLSRAGRHDVRCQSVEGGTFHSFAYKILKKYSHLVGFNDFSIIDESDAEEAVHICSSKAGAFNQEKRFPKKDTLKSIISMCVNKGWSVEEVLESEYPNFLDYTEDIEKIKQNYAKYKIEKRYMDYDDLLVYLRALLSKHKEITAVLSEKYKFVMVDEYQDTNMLQADIACLLAGNLKNIMAVGDDAQSIYSFRGASHENIMDFPRRFPGCKIIKLEENYRSSQAILDVANAVLEDMRKKYPKHLIAVKREPQEKPNLLFFYDIYEEAQWVAQKIKDQNDEGLLFGQQAVLFRSAYISIPLQAELSRRNIPYQVYGGLKFYETAHVKDCLAHMKILNNCLDELAWNRSLLLIEGIGPKTSAKILEQIKDCPSLEAVAGVLAQDKKESKFTKDLLRLTISLLKASRKTSIAGQLELVIDYYQPLLKQKFDDWDTRLRDLETLKDLSGRYSLLADFLADFAIEPPDRMLWHSGHRDALDEKPLILSTIHSAKGLEWDCVFFIGLQEGVLPVSFTLNDEEELEEEHRLFYVGVTRAKDKLFLSSHHENSSLRLNQIDQISRFVDAPAVLARLEKIWYPT